MERNEAVALAKDFNAVMGFKKDSTSRFKVFKEDTPEKIVEKLEVALRAVLGNKTTAAALDKCSEPLYNFMESIGLVEEFATSGKKEEEEEVTEEDVSEEGTDESDVEDPEDWDFGPGESEGEEEEEESAAVVDSKVTSLEGDIASKLMQHKGVVAALAEEFAMKVLTEISSLSGGAVSDNGESEEEEEESEPDAQALVDESIEKAVAKARKELGKGGKLETIGSRRAYCKQKNISVAQGASAKAYAMAIVKYIRLQTKKRAEKKFGVSA